MSYFDIDPRASDDLLQHARENPAQTPGVGFFEGAGSATVRGLAQAGAQPAALIGDAATTTLMPAAKSIDGLFGGSTVQDYLLSEQRKARQAVVDLMPGPDIGTAGQFLYGATSMVPQAVAGTVLGGPAGGAAVVGASQGYGSMIAAQSKGVDALTAIGQGAIEGGVAAAGVLMPMSVGAKLLPSIAVGVGGNVGLGVVSRGAVSTLLERRGYADMAKQYQAFDKESMAVDAVLGAAFGVVGAKMHRGEVARPAADVPPSAIDAALAVNARQHAEVQAAPGIPADPPARSAHGKALDQAVSDLTADRPVDVSRTGIEDVDFIPSRSEVRSAVQAAVEEMTPLAKALDDVDTLRAKAEELGLAAPDDPILTGRKLGQEIAAAGRQEPPAAGAGRQAEVFVGDRAEPVQFKVVEADTLAPQIGKADNQFRDRSRTASQLQITKIAQNLQFGRLADSPTMTDGAPTLALDGRIIGGNGRVAAVREAYERGLAADYRQHLEARAGEFGVSADEIRGMKAPVLVRQFANEVNVRQAAILSNEGGGLRMSALEQSKVDAERMPDLGSVDIPETGDLGSASMRPFIREWLARMPLDEQAALVDGAGKLSAPGLARARNGILFKAYGDSATLARLVESADEAQRNVANALVKAAPNVAEARDMIAGGDLHDLDVQPQLLQAVEQFAELRASGMKVDEFVNQGDMFGNGIGPEATAIMRFMEANKRSGKALAEAITGYYDAVRALGDPKQASMFEAQPPSRAEILAAVLRGEDATDPIAIRQSARAIDPAIERLPETARQILLRQFESAEREKHAFDALVSGIAEEVGGSPRLAKLKGVQRTVEKVAADYAGDPLRIKDILRATVQVDSIEAAHRAVAEIEAKFDVLPEGRRNLLDPAAPSMDGYRDAKFNVRAGDIIAEVQVNLPDMLAAKKQVHGLYAERATLEREFGAGEMPAAVQARVAELTSGMREAYDAAWSRITMARKSSSESGAPLRRADSASKGRGGETSQQAQYGTSGTPAASDTGIPSTSKKAAPGEKASGSSMDDSVPRDAENATQGQVSQVLGDAPNARVVDEFGDELQAGLALREADAIIATAEQDANAYPAAVACALRLGTD